MTAPPHALKASLGLKTASTLVPRADGAASGAFVLYADGSSLNNPGPSGAGALLFDRDGDLVFRLSIHLGNGTSNFAEYRALILGADEALERGVDDIDIRMDSLLVVNQVNGLWKIKSPRLKELHILALRILSRFRRWKLSHIPREQNGQADKAAREASGSPGRPGA
ncbi:MAG: ribonuclease HI family protein [Deltaproteobacteria bacterium]|jgi:ribonuclease HI|nr:ribonuclease HI family protein [Deltaproteobacteria bacterium]